MAKMPYVRRVTLDLALVLRRRPTVSRSMKASFMSGLVASRWAKGGSVAAAGGVAGTCIGSVSGECQRSDREKISSVESSAFFAKATQLGGSVSEEM